MVTVRLRVSDRVQSGESTRNDGCRSVGVNVRVSVRMSVVRVSVNAMVRGWWRPCK